MKRNRIQVLSTVMIVLIASFGVFWTLEYSYRLGTHLFFADWSTYSYIDDDFVLTTGVRLLSCLYYLPIYIVTFTAIGSTLMLFNQYRRGFIFDPRTAIFLMVVGSSLFGVFLIDTIITMTEAAFLSQWNVTKEVLLPKYQYDAGDVVIAFAGIGFCMMGWISHEALKIQQENDSII